MNTKKLKSFEDIKSIVLYLRFSSHKQNETSIEGQRKVCEDFAKQHNLTITGEYVDRATSGSKDIEKRTSFLEMIADASKHKFDGVLIYKMDRFSRNTYETAYYMHKLEENGIALLTAIEAGNNNTPEDKLIRQVMIGFSAYYSQELSQKTLRGMKIVASKGQFVGGYVPYGYKVENKRLVIEPSEAPVVKEIFFRVKSGEGIKNIADDLNSRGLSKRGKPFNCQNIYNLLNCKKYLGKMTFGDIAIENSHEPLVSEEDFDAISKHPKRIRSKSFFDWVVPLFSGKIFCGECGMPLVGTSCTSHTGQKYYYYSCKNKNCKLNSIQRDMFNFEILNFIYDVVYQDNLLEKIIEEAINILKQGEKDYANQLKALDKEKEDLENKIVNLVSFSASNQNFSFIQPRIEIMRTQLNEVNKKREKIVEKNSLNSEKLRLYAKKVCEKFYGFDYSNGGANGNITNVDICKTSVRKSLNFDNFCTFFLNKVVTKIVVFNDKTCKIELAFNIDDESINCNKNEDKVVKVGEKTVLFKTPRLINANKKEPQNEALSLGQEETNFSRIWRPI